MTYPLPQVDTDAFRRLVAELETAQRAADPLAGLRSIAEILTELAADAPDSTSPRRRPVVAR